MYYGFASLLDDTRVMHWMSKGTFVCRYMYTYTYITR